MNKKYELLEDDFIKHNGRILYRIRALKDFNNVKTGDLGGFVKSESNLSHYGDCWIYDSAKVYDNAKIYGDAKVSGNAKVYGYAKVCNNAKVSGNAKVYNNAEVYDLAQVYDNAWIYGNAKIFGDTLIHNNATICKNAEIHTGNIIGRVSLPYKDIFQYQCQNRMLTAILSKNNEILYTIGCQDDITEEELIKRIHDKDGGLEDNPHRKEYLRLMPIINIYFEGE